MDQKNVFPTGIRILNFHQKSSVSEKNIILFGQFFYHIIIVFIVKARIAGYTVWESKGIRFFWISNLEKCLIHSTNCYWNLRFSRRLLCLLTMLFFLTGLSVSEKTVWISVSLTGSKWLKVSVDSRSNIFQAIIWRHRGKYYIMDVFFFNTITLQSKNNV